jgi:hypothetical protein
MKTLSKVLLVGAVVLSLGTTSAFAGNAVKGQKLFIKKYKEACGLNGAEMAGKYTQDEWESLMDDGKIVDEMKTICPNIKEVKEKFVPHLYEFYYKYASDSGNVPSC